MEALTQRDCYELREMDDLPPLDNYSWVEQIPSMCTNDLFEDLMKGIVKAIMEKEREENKQLIIKTSMSDRVTNCYSYFERTGLSNMITNNQYCRSQHLPIINFITDKAVQAITNDKCIKEYYPEPEMVCEECDPEFKMLCKECKIKNEQIAKYECILDNDTEFKMLCKECRIDDKQRDTIKKTLRFLAFQLDRIDNQYKIMRRLTEYDNRAREEYSRDHDYGDFLNFNKK
jgi:hypothetical protein